MFFPLAEVADAYVDVLQHRHGDETVTVRVGLHCNILKLSDGYEDAGRCDSCEGLDLTGIYDSQGEVITEDFRTYEHWVRPRLLVLRIFRGPRITQETGSSGYEQVGSIEIHLETGKLLFTLDEDLPIATVKGWVYRTDRNRRPR